MPKEVGHGGFYFPAVYEKAQREVEACLERGEIDYAEFSKWTFADEFLCFVMDVGLLEFVDRTYPNPREKNEVPIWFLITCQFLLHIYQTGRYAHLNYLLNAGSILMRFGFNVGSGAIGFNDKNKKERRIVLHNDTVRKYFKDTDRDEIRAWYRHELQDWFKSHQAFDEHGIFILDQSHLVVPDNPHYEEAVKMPVDEHGQLYSNLSSLTAEQKQALVYHPCYTITVLLNIAPSQQAYHIASYDLGPGNEDELIQAKRLLPDFCRRYPGMMKELIVDRGYIDAELIEQMKTQYHVDVLVPLKTNMSNYVDAVNIAMMKNKWEFIEEEKDKDSGLAISKMEAACVNDMDLWPGLSFKQQAIVVKKTDLRPSKPTEHIFVLCSTKRYSSATKAFERYRLRVKIEERFRQFKHDWYITEFPSPHRSLIESHVCFTLFTYSLLQLYLRKKDMQEKTNRMIDTLKRDESTGKHAAVVYANHQYGIFDLDDYTVRVAGMQEMPRQKLIGIMEKQKATRIKREKAS